MLNNGWTHMVVSLLWAVNDPGSQLLGDYGNCIWNLVYLCGIKKTLKNRGCHFTPRKIFTFWGYTYPTNPHNVLSDLTLEKEEMVNTNMGIQTLPWLGPHATVGMGQKMYQTMGWPTILNLTHTNTANTFDWFDHQHKKWRALRCYRLSILSESDGSIETGLWCTWTMDIYTHVNWKIQSGNLTLLRIITSFDESSIDGPCSIDMCHKYFVCWREGTVNCQFLHGILMYIYI